MDQDTLVQRIEQLSADLALLHRAVHGTETETVLLGGVATPSYRKLVADVDARESAAAQKAIDAGVVAMGSSATDAANSAAAAAQSAQIASAGADVVTAHAQSIELVAANIESVQGASGNAADAAASAAAAAASAAEAEAAVPGNLATRVTTLETETATQQAAISTIVTNMPPLGGVASITGATALTTSSLGKLHICNGTSANYSVTLPPAVSCSGKMIGIAVAMGMTKLVTITGNAAELIDGAGARIMWAGESAQLYCDGTAWYKIGGQSIPMFGRMYLGANQSIAHAVNTKVLLNNSNGTRAPAQMCDTSNNRIMALRSSIWTIKVDSHILTTTPIASAMQTAIYRNGTYFSSVNRYVAQSDSPVVQDTETLMFAAGDYFEAYVIQYFNVSMVFDGPNTLNSMTVLESPIW